MDVKTDKKQIKEKIFIPKNILTFSLNICLVFDRIDTSSIKKVRTIKCVKMGKLRGIKTVKGKMLAKKS